MSDKGFVCSGCGCKHFYVHKTTRKYLTIQRVRICRNCGKRLYTHERQIGSVVTTKK